MYLTVRVERGPASEQGASVMVDAPFQYRSEGSNPGVLYYTRLPANMSADDVVDHIVRRDWRFVVNAEQNFIAVFVTGRGEGQSWTLVRDRYGSQRVLMTTTKHGLLVTTNPWLVRDQSTRWNPEVVRQAIISRMLTEAALEEGVSVLPLWHGLTFDQTVGLVEIATGAEELTVRESRCRLSDGEAISQIKASILESYQQLDTEQPVAILLSGGVDSFVLTALAKQSIPRLIAYTPTWADEPNPELQRAVRFARQLDIEHRVITVAAEDFETCFFEMIEANGVPVRNYSSLTIHALFKAISERQIIYGEYADTLFGSFAIKSGMIDQTYSAMLRWIPGILLPRRIREIAPSIERVTTNKLVDISGMDEGFVERCLAHLGVGMAKKPNTESAASFSRISGIECNLRNDCCQHMVEIETSALLLGKTVVTPFYNGRMMALSNRLSTRQMFGASGVSVRRNFRQRTDGDVKPLLKALACEFIEPDAIYLKKLGFSIPFRKWVSHVDAVSGIQRYPGAKGAEQIWSSINLAYLANRVAAAADSDQQMFDSVPGCG
ncbi:hypothetical protein LPB19_08630 [Marinobacter salinisoli]|uniref:asparagine synthase (glutamine-hydrolyzing) n=1 Tax=Marinobacter salinisoli TaxID=2769486 RepID=A0ABX7MMN5_9GAMM|nr:asparagine synthase-related protein [Marinobacter salinisoli]QSP93304.1 hypothetical protein LPB19_08630 [Marinobacter salinisoli]